MEYYDAKISICWLLNLAHQRQALLNAWVRGGSKSEPLGSYGKRSYSNFELQTSPEMHNTRVI